MAGVPCILLHEYYRSAACVPPRALSDWCSFDGSWLSSGL